MIQDYKNKNVLACMKRQLNETAKEGDREARITFVLIHILSAHHELMEGAGGIEENKQYRFLCYCLSTIADDMEDKEGPLAAYRKERFPLQDLPRHRTPCKDAVKNGLEDWQEWPSDVPHEQWLEDAIRDAYVTLFGLYYWNTPVKDMMRWLGKNEPKNDRFVNASSSNETIANIEFEKADVAGMKEKKPKKTMYLSGQEIAAGMEHVNDLQQMFRKLVGMLGRGNTLRFCREKEDTAFGVFVSGIFAMMMPGKGVNRKAMASSKNSDMVYQAAKKSLIGDKVLNGIVTNDDDKAASEVFHWGLTYGKMGVEEGSMPTGLSDIDIRSKPGAGLAS